MKEKETENQQTEEQRVISEGRENNDHESGPDSLIKSINSASGLQKQELSPLQAGASLLASTVANATEKLPEGEDAHPEESHSVEASSQQKQTATKEEEDDDMEVKQAKEHDNMLPEEEEVKFEEHDNAPLALKEGEEDTEMKDNALDKEKEEDGGVKQREEHEQEHEKEEEESEVESEVEQLEEHEDMVAEVEVKSRRQQSGDQSEQANKVGNVRRGMRWPLARECDTLEVLEMGKEETVEKPEKLPAGQRKWHRVEGKHASSFISAAHGVSKTFTPGMRTIKGGDYSIRFFEAFLDSCPGLGGPVGGSRQKKFPEKQGHKEEERHKELNSLLQVQLEYWKGLVERAAEQVRREEADKVKDDDEANVVEGAAEAQKAEDEEWVGGSKKDGEKTKDDSSTMPVLHELYEMCFGHTPEARQSSQFRMNYLEAMLDNNSLLCDVSTEKVPFPDDGKRRKDMLREYDAYIRSREQLFRDSLSSFIAQYRDQIRRENEEVIKRKNATDKMKRQKDGGANSESQKVDEPSR